MEYRTLDEIRPAGTVTPATQEASRSLRRERLERLAHLLEEHTGPLKLLSGMEYVHGEARLALRADNSPLEIAYADPVLRGQGLKGDTLGDAVAFFDLSQWEAHNLFCDCHYVGAITSRAVAGQARAIARKTTFRDFWRKVWSALPRFREPATARRI
ncbi:hypothetical protein ACFQU1_19080 [Chelatococcus sp. GCM10030263]|uniref:hypothetical protein n=1 Tax=Chelatococcus sp. GCM10030263 TaxID=3273387 RepID=UPI003621190A